MEWFKQLKQTDPYLTLARFILAVAGVHLCVGLFSLGLTFFDPSNVKIKKLATFAIVTAVVNYFFYLTAESKYRLRQLRRTDARLRGLAEYVEELRAYTVPRIDSIEAFLTKNGQEESPPPPIEVPTESEIEKPLSTRERDTLLTIIAALAKVSKIDIIKAPGKSAQYIEGLTDDLGASVSKRAIENHLKKIPNALETRMK